MAGEGRIVPVEGWVSWFDQQQRAARGWRRWVDEAQDVRIFELEGPLEFYEGLTLAHTILDRQTLEWLRGEDCIRNDALEHFGYGRRWYTTLRYTSWVSDFGCVTFSVRDGYYTVVTIHTYNAERQQMEVALRIELPMTTRALMDADTPLSRLLDRCTIERENNEKFYATEHMLKWDDPDSTIEQRTRRGLPGQYKKLY